MWISRSRRRLITALAVVTLVAVGLSAPVAAQVPANKGASTPKVGLYLCPGSFSTYLSILPRGRFLGPYTTRTSTPSRFRATGGAMYPGGSVIKMLDGPYKKLDTVRYEYYPKGSNPYGTRYDEPRLHIVSLPDVSFVASCTWIKDNPYLS